MNAKRNNKVIVIGSRGMAGHLIVGYLKYNTNFNVLGMGKSSRDYSPDLDVDANSHSIVEQILTDQQPLAVVNCIGLLNQQAESNPDKAILLNTYFPHFLARICSSIGAQLIHISTDCVFSGAKGAYRVEDTKDGVGFYAQSKALGEVVYGGHLTIRTSIIGPELKDNGIGLFHWFMQQQQKIKGYTMAKWSGVTTLELAKSIVYALHTPIQGLWQLTNGVPISKYDLLKLLANYFRNNAIEIVADDQYRVDKSLVPNHLAPDYSVPDYATMIKELKDWMQKNPEQYPRYS